MLDPCFSDLIALRHLGPGRILFSCRQLLEALDDWEASPTPPADEDLAAARKVRARAIEVIASAERALTLDRTRQAAAAAHPRSSLKATDAAADRLLGNLHRALKAALSDFPSAHPRHAAAAALKARLFPRGAKAITTSPCVEQLAQMQALLTDAAALAPHVQALGLADQLARLAEVSRDYAAALAPSDEDPVTSAHALDALRDANAQLRRLVAVTLGHLDGDDDAQTRLRAALLAPILRQHDAAFRARLAHSAADADPSTGEDLPAATT